MKITLVALSLIAAPAFAGRPYIEERYIIEVKPDPGRETFTPLKPDFCAGHKGEYTGGDKSAHLSSLLRNFNYEKKDELYDFVDSARDIGPLDWPQAAAQASCDYPDEPLVLKAAASWMQTWINVTGMSVAEAREAMRLSIIPEKLDQGRSEMLKQVEPKAPKDTIEWFLQNQVRMALQVGSMSKPGGNDWRGIWEMAYWNDIRPSQIVQAARVWQCLPYEPLRTNWDWAKRYALCGAEARHFDDDAFAKELAALKLNEYGQLAAKIRYRSAKTLGQRAAVWFEKATNGMDEFRKMVVSISDEAFGRQSKDEAVLAPARAVESKYSALSPDERKKPQQIGCDELRAAVRRELAAAKSKSAEDVRRWIDQPVGTVLWSRLSLCDALEGRHALAAAEWQLIHRTYGGPRLDIFWSLLDAVGKNEAIARDAHMDGAEFKDWRPEFDWIKQASVDIWVKSLGGTTAVIDDPEDANREAPNRRVELGKVVAAKPGPNGVTLTFKKEKIYVPQVSCKNTGGINFWTPSGQPVYNQHCDMAKGYFLDYEMKPITVDKMTAAGVKPGTQVKLARARGSNGFGLDFGIVFEVDEAGKGKSAAPRAASYFGVPLK
jgi:hypothetical protein